MADQKKLLPGLQKASYPPGTSSYEKIKNIASEMFRQEGFRAFYKGITPRVLRVAPGQAVVFPVYDLSGIFHGRVSRAIYPHNTFIP